MHRPTLVVVVGVMVIVVVVVVVVNQGAVDGGAVEELQ